jgi:hypothetical protein
MMKGIIYRFAVWLEYRAQELQDWSLDRQFEAWPEYNDVVIGGINSDPAPFWKNATEGNAFLKSLKDK